MIHTAQEELQPESEFWTAVARFLFSLHSLGNTNYFWLFWKLRARKFIGAENSSTLQFIKYFLCSFNLLLLQVYDCQSRDRMKMCWWFLPLPGTVVLWEPVLPMCTFPWCCLCSWPAAPLPSCSEGCLHSQGQKSAQRHGLPQLLCFPGLSLWFQALRWSTSNGVWIPAAGECTVCIISLTLCHNHEEQRLKTALGNI